MVDNATTSLTGMSGRRRWSSWLFALVLGPLTAVGVFVALGGTATKGAGPSWHLLPALGAGIGALVATPWSFGEPRTRVAVRALVAAMLGAALAVGWAFALLFVLLAIACYGKQQCLG